MGKMARVCTSVQGRRDVEPQTHLFARIALDVSSVYDRDRGPGIRITSPVCLDEWITYFSLVILLLLFQYFVKL